MAQAQPEFGLTLPILLLCCSEFLKRALEIWRPWSINCDGRGPSRVLGGLSATRKQSSLTGCRHLGDVFYPDSSRIMSNPAAGCPQVTGENRPTRTLSEADGIFTRSRPGSGEGTARRLAVKRPYR